MRLGLDPRIVVMVALPSNGPGSCPASANVADVAAVQMTTTTLPQRPKRRQSQLTIVVVVVVVMVVVVVVIAVSSKSTERCRSADKKEVIKLY